MSERRGPNPPDEDGGVSWTTYAADMASSAGAVVLVGALVFAVSGVWPPLVAIESQSMTPNMRVGDLVFVMEEDRFPGGGAHGETGVVTNRDGQRTDYRKFGNPGDVIVFAPDGNNDTTPVIHRAVFWVEKDERWVDEADPEYLGGAEDCADVSTCPADHAGFVTRGDHNGYYDQVGGISDVVKPSWILGTAEMRIPYLGCIRLRFSAASPTPDQCRLLA